MSSFRQNTRGSITLVALSLAVVVGISLGSYLALCQQSLLFSTRALQQSKARQLAETGLEEALWALNSAANPDSNVNTKAWNISPTAPTIPVGSGDPWRISWPRIWTIPITGYDLGDGATGTLKINIQDYHLVISRMPVITVTATVTVPGLGVFTKTLTATTKAAPVFANAIGIVNPQTNPTVASNTYAVIFNSGGLVDSWDSDYLGYAPVGPIPITGQNRDLNPTAASYTPYPGTNPGTIPSPQNPYPISAPSTYPDLSFNYAAVVGAPNIRANDAEIRGYAITFGNSITTNSNTKIHGPSALVTPPPIDQTRGGKSAFVPNFTVGVPSGNSGSLSPAYTSSFSIPNIGSNVWYAPSGLEVDGTLGGATGITLDVTQPTVIVVQGDLFLHHAGRIKIVPPDGRLEIFVQGNVTIGPFAGSTAGFQNDTNEPKKLALYCTSPTRTFQYQSTRDFCGVIFSTSVNSKIQFLSATPNPVIYGAILANYNVEFDSGMSPQIHYDTALQYLPKGWFKGIITPYLIVQVTES